MSRFKVLIGTLISAGASFAMADVLPDESDRYTFQQIIPPGESCSLVDMDNGHVVGTVESNGQKSAFYWTKSRGVQVITALDNNNQRIIAVSGNRAVGQLGSHAFTWTPKTGIVMLGDLGQGESWAHDVEGDTVVGIEGPYWQELDTARAFKWTPKEGMKYRPLLSGSENSGALKIHKGFITGYATYAGQAMEARRPIAWRPNGTPVDIVNEFPYPLLEGYVYGHGAGRFVRNRMVAGDFIATKECCEAFFTHAFLWTQQSGLIDLGTLPGYRASGASAVYRGRVTGNAYDDIATGSFINRGFLWTPEDGLIRMGTDEIRASATMMHGKKVFGGYSVAGDEHGRSYMWTERRGMVNITPAAWKGSAVFNVQDDGSMLVNATRASDSASICGVLTPAPRDSDEDGIPNKNDVCDDSDTAPTVSIGRCGAGVPNIMARNGCSISDQIDECADSAREQFPFKHHDRRRDQFERCVDSLTERLKRSGVINKKQVQQIDRCT